jgi:hypothetical protein
MKAIKQGHGSAMLTTVAGEPLTLSMNGWPSANSPTRKCGSTRFVILASPSQPQLDQPQSVPKILGCHSIAVKLIAIDRRFGPLNSAPSDLRNYRLGRVPA